MDGGLRSLMGWGPPAPRGPTHPPGPCLSPRLGPAPQMSLSSLSPPGGSNTGRHLGQHLAVLDPPATCRPQVSPWHQNAGVGRGCLGGAQGGVGLQQSSSPATLLPTSHQTPPLSRLPSEDTGTACSPFPTLADPDLGSLPRWPLAPGCCPLLLRTLALAASPTGSPTGPYRQEDKCPHWPLGPGQAWNVGKLRAPGSLVSPSAGSGHGLQMP